MTVKELIEMLKTCDEESIVYIDYNGDINSINEVCDYSNNCGEVHGQSSCIKPENFNLGIGAAYAQIKAEDKIWKCLGFVLQWAKYGLKK